MNQATFDFQPQRVEFKKTESVKRDEILDRHEQNRGELIEIAKRIAIDICRAAGEVTSPQVVEQLRQDRHLAEKLKTVDKRFMGAVFRSKLWRRVRFDPAGSHAQPISVWTFNQE